MSPRRLFKTDKKIEHCNDNPILFNCTYEANRILDHTVYAYKSDQHFANGHQMVDILQSDNNMEQSPNLYLQNFYTQLASGSPYADRGTEKTIPHHYYHNHHHQQYDKPEEIDQQVAVELQHLKTHYANEEQRYVDQMLIENPVIVERRAPPMALKEQQRSQAGTTIPTTAKSRSHGSSTTNRDDAQRQRAESCRKSRYNNKIKKAKLRFRHKFVCSQLNESAGVLDYMREVIAQAESQLLARGFNRVALERMRQTFGVNPCNGNGAAIMEQ